MATLRNRRELAAFNKENFKENSRINLAQNSRITQSQANFITQDSKEIGGRKTKKLHKEFSRTEGRILGAPTRPENFLLIPLFQVHSGSAPKTSRDTLNINQGTNEDDFQVDSETRVSETQTTQVFGPDDSYDMVTGDQEYIPYCSPGTSSRKQKKAL